MFPNTCLPIFLIVPYKRSSGSKKNLNIENDDDLGDDNKDDARQADYIRKAFNSDKTTEILHYNRHEISIIEMITFQIWLFYYEFYNGLNWGVSMKKYKTFFFQFGLFLHIVVGISTFLIENRQQWDIWELGKLCTSFFLLFFLCNKVNRIWLKNSLVKAHHVHVQWSTNTCIYYMYMYIASMVFAPLTIARQREIVVLDLAGLSREALQQQRTWWIPDLFKVELMYTPSHYLHRSIMNAAPDYELIEAPQGHLMHAYWFRSTTWKVHAWRLTGTYVTGERLYI